MQTETCAEYSSERVSNEYLKLNSCGVENLGEIDRGSFRRNGRIDYHILYIEKGVCRLIIDGRETEVKAGGIVFFHPGEPQMYRFLAQDRSISHYIHFTGTGCSELLTKLGIADIRVFDMGTTRSYEELSKKLVREFIMKPPLYESWCSAYLYGLLNIIARKYALRNSNINYTNESRIYHVCSRIYDNLASPPSLAELCLECCLSKSRFIHLFKKVTGKSVVEFTRSMRMNRAKELLLWTDLSVREIAEAVGYDDQNYFSRIFKQNVGYAPTAYRNNCN